MSTINSYSNSNVYKYGGSSSVNASTSATARGLTAQGTASYDCANGASASTTASATESYTGNVSASDSYGYTNAAGQTVASGSLTYTNSGEGGTVSYNTQNLGSGSLPVGSNFDFTA